MELGKMQVVRTVKRLSQAIGYLELGMSQQALELLRDFDQPGPFTAVAEMLRGEAARIENRTDDVADSLENAARMLSAPDSKSIWLALSEFHRQAGNIDLAVKTLAYARGARPLRAKPETS